MTVERLDRKQRTVAALDAMVALGESIGLVSLARDIREIRLPKFNEERLSMVVLGEFNHGKSTFLNAILGHSLLPVGATPTTGALCQLQYGDEFSAEAIFLSGNRQPIALSGLDGWLRGHAPIPAGESLDRVVVHTPSAFLQDRLTVVDTPGVNDLSLQRADITDGYVPRADAIVFLLDATQVLTSSERAFLSQHGLRAYRHRLVFAVTKSDLLDEVEQIEVETFARRELATLIPEPTLFFISAKRALAGDRVGSGLDALSQHLQHLFTSGRQQLLLDNALDDAERISRFLRQGLSMRKASLGLSREALLARRRKAEGELDEGRRALERAATTLRDETGVLKARVRQNVDTIVQQLCSQLPGDLQRADAIDIERHLGPFLEDTFRAFIEYETELLGEGLHSTAENVISAASEKLDETARAVVEAMGHARDALPIEAPTLGAEASVFALGALGTTALLFVSTLMGGVVALATPAVAAIARARAAEKARGEAIEKVPGWIRSLGGEIEPRLLSVIDDFASRMSAFIDEAGAALARGIAEVLDRALADLDAGKSTDATNAQILELQTRLRQVEESLIEIRQSRDNREAPAYWPT
ncbi:MAG: dynamin family protein [Deltaproteobacteria bacterium]|nr:dynamin family protein [Deltaproteobacteria bacterium]